MVKKHKRKKDKLEVSNLQNKIQIHKQKISYFGGILFFLIFAGIGVKLLSGSGASPQIVGSITNFTNPSYLTQFQFGSRSFWDQPSRAYMNTVPATKLLDSVGINYDPGFKEAPQANNVYKLLHDSGIKRVRFAFNWSSFSYANPNQLNNIALQNLTSKLTLVKQYGIRPMLTLEAYQQNPVPFSGFNGKFLIQPKVGDITVKVDPSTASQIIPNLSGFDRKNQMMGIIFTSVKNGVVTLSRPIDSRTDITGKIRLMRFGPFQKPFLADGVTPNPAFRATMDGWLSYIKNACSIAKSIYGSDQFDLEIWNELIYSYTFLDADNYYQTSPDVTATGNTRQEILKETGAFIKNPANGFTNVRITNGFANQSPYPSAQGNPDGITALSKHDYTPHQRIYPGDLEYTTLAPLDALLQRNTKNSSPPWIDSFVPSYVAHYPEEWQSALFTEAQTRDMSPITTYISGAAHGTNATNANGQKSQVWETEWGTEVLPDPQGLQPTTTGGGPKHKYTWDQPSLKYIQAKSDIRYLSSYVNKGLSVVDFFSATARGELRMVDSNFLNQIDSNPSVYPGDSAGGTIMQTLQRFTNAFSAAKPITAPINLSLNQLDDYTGNIQFKGNGSLQYPNLYNRDMFGFFPYQLTNTSFLIPVYVQTLDIEKIYNSGDTNVTKFDMPSETYRLTIGGLNGNAVNSVSLYDPLTQAKPGVNILSRSSNNLVIEVPVTDSPRLLYISLNPNFSPPTIKKPTVNITNPINGTSVSGKINVQANATSDLSTSVVSTQFFLNGKQLSHLIFPPSSCNINCPAFSYTWDTSTLLGGQYTLIAVVQDGLGNTVQSLPITVTVTNSIAKPTINIVTPYDKAIVSGKVIIQSTATTDPSTSVKNVQYFLDKLPLSSLLTNGPTYTYSWDTSITTATRHTLQALVFDNLGNKAYSKTFLIKVR